MTIAVEQLIRLHTIGFKLVPLGEDAKAPNVAGLLTDEEQKRSIEESKDEKGHPINFIYNHPEFWNEDRIAKEAWRFHNVATTFGKIHLKDEQGQDLYLNCLDIDSQNVYDILFNLENGKTKESYSFIPRAQQATFVTKTRKKHGFHVHWFSHKQNEPIFTHSCKQEFEFEIKTDNRNGTCTLPPSTHREDLEFHYEIFGQNKMLISDGLYDELKEVLDSCLNDNKRHEDESTKNDYLKNRRYFKGNEQTSEFTDEEIKTICELIRPYYRKGCKCRHEIVYGLCGLCHKHNIGKQSGLNLIQTIAYDDEEKKSRLITLERTYVKDPQRILLYWNQIALRYKRFESISILELLPCC
jgi:hypothetical protein